MKVQVTINGKDVEAHLNRRLAPEGQLRKIVAHNDTDWETADLFVANYPEPGRHLQKCAGFKSVVAGG